MLAVAGGVPMGGSAQIVRFGVLCMWILTVAFFSWLAPVGAASAQSICKQGPTKYRKCCRESYRNNPGLGARTRADDILECMERSRSRRSDDVAKGRSGDDERRRAAGTPPPKWNSPRPTWYRRLDCAAGECSAGCSQNELAVSAFCSPGSSPTMYADGSIYCANAAGKTEWPTVIICGTK